MYYTLGDCALCHQAIHPKVVWTSRQSPTGKILRYHFTCYEQAHAKEH